ncbi:MAG: DUF6938 domain-containing protein [Minisyncoccales bacterium]
MEEAIIVSVSMGYGHQRTAFHLRSLGRIINVNDCSIISERERNFWKKTAQFYHFISSLKSFPLFGSLFFEFFNFFQRIEKFYPKKKAEKANFYLKTIYYLIKRGWGRDLIFHLSQEEKPLISTFFVPAFFADFFGYKKEIFCLVCDADISRIWAPIFPEQSKIKYFAPTERVQERLMLYGVKKENIFLTGYPLSPLIFSEEKVRNSFLRRVLKLDPQGRFLEKYRFFIENKIGHLSFSEEPLKILFSLGGAGAQKELALLILRSLKEEIKKGRIDFILSVGINKKAKEFFEKKILEIFSFHPKNISLLFFERIEDYFEAFDQTILEADLLITKPSELSFYSQLGIPLLLLPPIGYQEIFNEDWLLKNNFAIKAKNLNYFSEWFFDFLNEGFFAKCAFLGFWEGKRGGYFEIEKIIEKK